MRVGDRAGPVKNPTGEFDDSLGRDVDPATWRKLVLRAEKRDGTYCDIELLRPEWWIAARSAKEGASVFISVPECGIDGNAEVLAIANCPTIQPGTGPIIIGTFAHQSAEVINVFVEGLDEPIGVTTNHPFWSDTRQDFVPAGDLLPGERLHGIHNTPCITSISPAAHPNASITSKSSVSMYTKSQLLGCSFTTRVIATSSRSTSFADQPKHLPQIQGALGLVTAFTFIGWIQTFQDGRIQTGP